MLDPATFVKKYMSLECLIFAFARLTTFTHLVMKSGILGSKHVGLGDSILFELFGDGHHPTSRSSSSDVGNQLECLSFLHSHFHDGFVDTSKSFP